MQRLLIHKARFERNVLATLLPAIAGAVDASGFFAIGTYTSHMTGVVSRVGDELAQRHPWLAATALLLLGSFVFGAMLATALVLYARRRAQPAFWRPLLLESAILLCFASVNVGTGKGARVGSLVMSSLICIAMGLQNALVTKVSGARIRTTHLTGTSTDIGIGLMKLLDRWRTASAQERGLLRVRMLWSTFGDAEAKHLRLHLRILGSFLVGATVGPALYLGVGHWAMLIPAVFLASLAAFDLRFGLGSDGAAPVPALGRTPARES